MFLKDINFSIWCDYIERDFLLNGSFRDLINRGVVNGLTSNPTIFKNSFLNSSIYKKSRQTLALEDPKSIYEALAIEDVKIASKMLYPLFLDGDDGFVSIEVDPFVCDDFEQTILEAEYLQDKIQARNLMIKIPATNSGYEAMKRLVSNGFNVNATLVFSPKQAKSCLEAFKQGTSIFKENHNDYRYLPKAIISVFVSRIDRGIEQAGFEFVLDDNVTVGIVNSLLIYYFIEDYELPNVKTLFASTSVKDGVDLPKDFYIRNLIVKNAINTAPPDTIDAFLKTHISQKNIPYIDKKDIGSYIYSLDAKGINMDKIYSQLIKNGITLFRDSFKEILREFKQ